MFIKLLRYFRVLTFSLILSFPIENISTLNVRKGRKKGRMGERKRWQENEQSLTKWNTIYFDL